MIDLHGTKVQISREGIVSVWAQYYVADYREVSTVPSNFGNTLGGNPLALVEISAAQAEEGKQYVVTAKYEGLAEENLVNPTYAWEPEDAQTDIVINPNIKELWLRYGGEWDNDSGKVKWPQKIKFKGGKETDNPMFGVDAWLDLFGQWSETTAAAEIAEDLLADAWSIVENVPGDFPTPKNRLWLVLPPQITQRGACFEIRHRWKMTGVMTPERLEATRLIYKPVS